MKKKRILQLILAAAMTLTLVACQNENASVAETQSDFVITQQTVEDVTVVETQITEDSSVEEMYETLPEGQERDWKIEDVLKNDLEIDGIPISIPCTVEELLNTLGDGYSVDESEIVYEKTSTSCKYFVGDYNLLALYYNGEETGLNIDIIVESENATIKTANVIGLTPILYKTSVIRNITPEFTVEDCIEIYGLANRVDIDDDRTFLIYHDDASRIRLYFKDNKLTDTYAEYITEDVINE